METGIMLLAPCVTYRVVMARRKERKMSHQPLSTTWYIHSGDLVAKGR